MKSYDLIATARDLAELNPERHAQANLRRAVSTAYFAVFHSLACNAADLLIGSRRSEAWHQVYRALEHGSARSACRNKGALQKFPHRIREFAETFVALQDMRHRADYALDALFDKLGTLDVINDAENSIREFEQVHDQDRRGFVAHVLFKRRSP